MDKFSTISFLVVDLTDAQDLDLLANGQKSYCVEKSSPERLRAIPPGCAVGT